MAHETKITLTAREKERTIRTSDNKGKLMTSINISLEELISIAQGNQAKNGGAGRYALVRGDRSGVFCGVVVSEEGQTVELTEARHIWYWAGAVNVADMALNGVARPAECKIVAPVGRLRVLDTIEVVDCTPTAEASLRAVPVWSKK